MKYQHIITTLIFLFACNLVSGQVKLGIRFQTGISKVQSESQYLVSEGKRVDYQLTIEDVSNTRSIGFYSQFDFGYLYFQPELLYTAYNITYDVFKFRTESANNNPAIYTEYFHQIDFPINAGIKYKNFRLGGGPVFNYLQGINSGVSKLENIEKFTRKISAGFQGSIGYDYSLFHFDIKYQSNFNTATDHLLFNNIAIKSKANPSSIIFGIALALETNPK